MGSRNMCLYLAVPLSCLSVYRKLKGGGVDICLYFASLSHLSFLFIVRKMNRVALTYVHTFSTVMSCYVSQGEEELGLTYVCTWRSSVMSFYLLQSEKGLVCNVRV